MAEKYAAFGTILQLHDGGSPGAFATIAGVRDVPGPGFSRDLVDATAHDSPGQFEEMRASIIRSEEFTVPIVYDPAEATHNAATGLLGLVISAERRDFKIIWPDDANTEWEFEAITRGFTPSAPMDGLLTANVTFKPTGQPTLV